MANEDELKKAIRILVYWYDGVISLAEFESALAGLSKETIECFPDKPLSSDNRIGLRTYMLKFKAALDSGSFIHKD
jgi:hypothetical protein